MRLLPILAAAAATVWQHDGPAPAPIAPLACAAGTVTPVVAPAEITNHGEDFGALGHADVRVTLSIAGADACGLRAQIEVIAPPDSHLVDFQEPPVGCPTAADANRICRVAYRPGQYGGLIVDDARGATPTPWVVAAGDQPTSLTFPVTYDARIDTFNKSTERRCGTAGPCAPGASGGRTQVVVTFLPGTGAGVTPSAPVLTTVGMLDEGDFECCGDITQKPPRLKTFYEGEPPTSLSRADLRKGVVFVIEATKGTKAAATLTSPSGATIATATKRASGAARLSLTLKAGKTGLKRAAGAKPATLTLTRTGGDYDPFILNYGVRLKGR